jgi:predicted nucleic acid-binding protein
LILYLDTSALVKLYVRERGSARTRRLIDRAQAVATSMVAYAEARAAFARLQREKRTSAKRHRARVAQLDRDWDSYALVELTAAVARRAGALAEEHGLRGFDAIHLASALWLQSAHSGDMQFSGFDERLDGAVRSAGLTVAD